MKKNPQPKPSRALSGFLRIFIELCGSKVQLGPRTKILSVALLTSKPSICCYVFKYFLLTDFLKKRKE